MKLRIFVTGRAYHQATRLPPELVLADDATLHDAIAAVRLQFPPDSPLADSALLALAGEHRGTIAKFVNGPLRDGQELMIIVPVAGG